jgi:pimeloyl-ACP methyl ester carboxylesterase
LGDLFVTEQVGWAPTRSGAVFAGLHLPDGSARATAVVLVPPFGWEGVSAGRNLRGWARDLAAAGHPTLRYQPPGAGDSSGVGVEQDVASWSGALVDLVALLRQAAGSRSVTVIGLGMGGLVALQAVADGAAVEDLVLWASPGRGRMLLRELRAFAAMAAEPGETSPSVPQPLEAVTTGDGVLWVHGYPLSARAQEQLARLDASELDLGGVQRALLLGRGTLPVDRKLVDALTAAGADVVTAPGPGFDELTVEPRLSQPVGEVGRTVQSWLRPEPSLSAPGPLEVVVTSEERQVLGDADAVVTRADAAVLTAVFVGAGAISRSGPNRLWTEAARRWAQWGISSVRLDLHSIGEAAGPDAYPHGPEGFYDERYRPQLRAALDALPELGLPDRFLLVGLCSGGFWSAQLALDDSRVAGVVVLNPVSLVWPPPLLSSGSRQYLRSRATWSRLLHDPGLRKEAVNRARRSAELALSHLRRNGHLLGTSHEVVEALHRAGTPIALGASPGEAILDDLALLGPEIRGVVRRFTGPEGAHTLSTAGLRAQAEELMDEVAAVALAAVRAGVPGAHAAPTG